MSCYNSSQVLMEGGTDNAYSYVNDPVNSSDYSGQWGISFGGILAAAQALLGAVAAAAPRILPAPVAHAVQTVANAAAATISRAATKRTVAAPTRTQRQAASEVFSRVTSRPVTPQAMSTNPGTYSAWPGYVNLGVSVAALVPIPGSPVPLPVTAGFGVMVSAEGVRGYNMKGNAYPRGLGVNITYSPSEMPAGCSNGLSAGYWLGGSVDTDGNWEAGIVSPGMATQRTCVGSMTSW